MVFKNSLSTFYESLNFGGKNKKREIHKKVVKQFMNSLRTQVFVLYNKLTLAHELCLTTIMEPTHCTIKLELFWGLKPTIRHSSLT